MDRLNVLRAHQYPTVTGSMDAIIDYVEGLIERGYAYAADGDVYFEVDKFEAYGQLSRRTDERASCVGVRDGAGARQAGPARLRPLEARQAGRAVLAQSLGRRPARLAHRVLGDGPRDARRPDRHSRRRARPDLPAPRERAGPERGVHRTSTRSCATGRTPGWSPPAARRWRTRWRTSPPSRSVLDVYEPMVVRLFLLQTHYRSSILYPARRSDERRAGADAAARRPRRVRRGDRRRGTARRWAEERPRGVRAGDGRRLQHARRARGALRPGSRDQPPPRRPASRPARSRPGSGRFRRWRGSWACNWTRRQQRGRW